MTPVPVRANPRRQIARTVDFEPYYQVEPAEPAKTAKPAPDLTPLDLMFAYYDAA